MKPSTTVPAKQRSIPVRVCLQSGCRKKLRPDNEVGYCQRHYYKSHIGPQVCQEAGCRTRLFDTNTTGYCIRHRYNARGIPQINGEELESRRRDDQWEKKHGERNTVACRICGILRARLGTRGSKHHKLNHLLDDHKLTVPEYRQHCKNRGWGTPPLESLKTREAAAQWWRNNHQKRKTYDLRKRAKNKLRRAADPQFQKHEYDQHRKNVQGKLSEAERNRRIRCEMPGCGLWFRSLAIHLRRDHNMSVGAYKDRFPNARTIAPDLAALRISRIRTALAKQRQDELGRRLAEHGIQNRKRGKEGETTRVTDARITLTACRRRQGMKDYDTAPELYPLHETKAAAWNAAKNAIIKNHASDIREEERRVAALSEAELQAEITAAKRLIPRRLPEG
jgi:predicted transcriptional regulator